MKDQKVKHSDNNGKGKKNAGFYIALALCIAAIGGAAWTTYSSVLDYQTPKEESSVNPNNSKQNEKEAGKTVSGIEYSTEDSKKVENSEKTANTLPITSSDESSEEESPEESSGFETGYESSDESSKTKDEIVKPIDGKVIKGFSAENPIYSKTMEDWRVHEGIDIAADDGEKVRSYADGIVKKVYNDELFGYTIKIEHTTGITMTYSGLSPTTLVKEGDNVSAGDYIGAVFTVPSEIMDETHLHLKAEKDGKIVDAQAVLEQQG